MKDYYAILGVEEEASQDEIRDRWIELNKHYHPDLLQSDEAGEHIKEINEAYQVLKDPATRFQYDLEITLKRSIQKKMAYDTERKRARKRKIIMAAGISVMGLVLGSFVFFELNKPRPLREVGKIVIPESVKLIEPPKREEPQKPEEPKKPIIKPEAPVQVAKVIPKEQPKVVELKKPEVAKKPEEPKKPVAKPEVPRKTEKPQKLVPKPEAPVQVARVIPKEQPKVSKKPEEPKKPEAPVQAAKIIPEEPPKVVELKKPEEPKKLEEPKMPEAPAKVAKVEPREKEPVKPAPQESAKLIEPQKPEIAPPPVFREEEVNQFFARYVDRYNRKDVEGFLSSFSPRALQNKKDGLEKIKGVYRNFFNQSQELQYEIRDLKVARNPGGVEAQARYELNQVSKKSGGKKIWKGNIRWVLVKEDGALKIISLDYQHEK